MKNISACKCRSLLIHLFSKFLFCQILAFSLPNSFFEQIIDDNVTLLSESSFKLVQKSNHTFLFIGRGVCFESDISKRIIYYQHNTSSKFQSYDNCKISELSAEIKRNRTVVNNISG